MIERVDVPAGVACPYARIRWSIPISERSARAVKGLTVAAHDAMTLLGMPARKIRRGAWAMQRKAKP